MTSRLSEELLLDLTFGSIILSIEYYNDINQGSMSASHCRGTAYAGTRDYTILIYLEELQRSFGGASI